MEYDDGLVEEFEEAAEEVVEEVVEEEPVEVAEGNGPIASREESGRITFIY